MRRHVQEVPNELPHARLYLDDIETITRILTEEISQAMIARARDHPTEALAEANAPAAPEIKVLYRIGQEEMDSIDDLLSQGGNVANLEVRVSERGAWLPCWLRFHWASPPRVDLHDVREGKEWEIHAKVREVFEKRGMPVKNFIGRLPDSIKYGAFAFMALRPAITLLFKGTAREVFYALQASIFFVFICCFVAAARPSRVYLVRSHERSRATSETRRKYVIGAITFALGVLFTKLLDHFLARFLK
jgi:hypothetical protein